MIIVIGCGRMLKENLLKEESAQTKCTDKDACCLRRMKKREGAGEDGVHLQNVLQRYVANIINPRKRYIEDLGKASEIRAGKTHWKEIGEICRDCGNGNECVV